MSLSPRLVFGTGPVCVRRGRASATPARPAAGVALQTRAVAHQGEVAAFAAAFAFVALDARFRRAIEHQVFLGDAGLVALVELLGELAGQLRDAGVLLGLG